MSWGRIDDGLHDHEKFMGFGPATTPREQWMIGLSWTHRNYKRFSVPGFVPADMPTVWAGSKVRGNRLAARLVERGLWEITEGGWIFHDWLDYASPEECRHFGAEPPDPHRVDTKPRSGRTVSPATAERLREAGRRGGRRSGEVRRKAVDDHRDSPDSEASAKPHEASEASSLKPQTKPKASQGEAFPKPEPEPAPRASEASGFKPEAPQGFKPQASGRTEPSAPQHELSNRPAVLAGVANELVDEYAAAFTHSIPRRTRAQLYEQVDALLGEGFTREQVRAGLIALSRRRGAGPGLLPNLVHDALSGPPLLGAVGQASHRPQSAAAERQASLADLHRELTGQQPTQPPLPGAHLVVIEGQITERTA